MPTRVTDHRRGVLLAAGGLLLISLESLGIRLSEAGSWDFAFWFGISTAVSMSVLVRVRERITPVAAVIARPVPVVGAACLQATSTVFFILAINTTTVANTVAILAATPIVAASLAWLVLRERVSTRVVVAIASSVGGILTIVAGSVGAGRLVGDAFAVVAITAYASNVTLWRSHPTQNWTISIALAGVFMALVATVPADPLAVDMRAFAIIVVLGGITGPVGRVALATATRFLPAATVSLFTPVETVAATAWAWLFLSEAPPLTTVVGGAVVIGAVVYGSRRR